MDSFRAKWRRGPLGIEPFNSLFSDEKARHRSKRGCELRIVGVRSCACDSLTSEEPSTTHRCTARPLGNGAWGAARDLDSDEKARGDEKELDFQAGFLELGTSSGSNSISLRVGRQELEYGSGRLIDVREGPNVRLSFDGFMLKSKLHAWQIDGFAVRPDLDKPGFFDNAPNHAVGFWGIYATRSLPHKNSLDVYYLGLNRKEATFQRGMAQEVRHSLGARFSRPVATEEPGWDFDYEGLWQFGTFGSANIKAWTVASDTGYRIPTIPLKPRFSAKADISSGDNPNSKTLGTFNPLFPKGNYFGVLATTGPGPINFIDVHPRVETALAHNVTVSFDWIVQWRENLNDGVYAVPGFLIRAADGSRARFVGHRPGTEVRWQANRHLWFQADYGIFYAGRFLRETQPGRNLNYWALWAGYKF